MGLTTRPVVGFIGVGAMGLPMARCIARAGFDVVAWDVRAGPLDQMRAQANVAASAREVGDRADIALACLPSLDAYRVAVIDGLSAGTRFRSYVHLGTTGAALVSEIAAALPGAVAVLDAPITGGVAKAVDGTLTTIASGPAAVLSMVRPVLQAYSQHIITVGDTPGLAQVMKLVNNIMSLANLAACCEAMLVGAKAGIDPRVMIDVLNKGSGQNSATATKIPRHVLPRSFDFGASLGIALKDSEQFLAEAAEQGIGVEVCRMAAAAFHAAAVQFGEAADMSNVIRPMEQAAQFVLPQSANT